MSKETVGHLQKLAKFLFPKIVFAKFVDLIKLGWFFYVINSFVTHWDYLYKKNFFVFNPFECNLILSVPRLSL